VPQKLLAQRLREFAVEKLRHDLVAFLVEMAGAISLPDEPAQILTHLRLQIIGQIDEFRPFPDVLEVEINRALGFRLRQELVDRGHQYDKAFLRFVCAILKKAARHQLEHHPGLDLQLHTVKKISGMMPAIWSFELERHESLKIGLGNQLLRELHDRPRIRKVWHDLGIEIIRAGQEAFVIQNLPGEADGVPVFLDRATKRIYQLQGILVGHDKARLVFERIECGSYERPLLIQVPLYIVWIDDQTGVISVFIHRLMPQDRLIDAVPVDAEVEDSAIRFRRQAVGPGSAGAHLVGKGV
jgi:hypothetical protein